MTLKTLYGYYNLINDKTTIVIRSRNDIYTLTKGYWFQDNILFYLEREINSFTWSEDNTIKIILK